LAVLRSLGTAPAPREPPGPLVVLGRLGDRCPGQVDDRGDAVVVAVLSRSRRRRRRRSPSAVAAALAALAAALFFPPERRRRRKQEPLAQRVPPRALKRLLRGAVHDEERRSRPGDADREAPEGRRGGRGGAAGRRRIRRKRRSGRRGTAPVAAAVRLGVERTGPSVAELVFPLPGRERVPEERRRRATGLLFFFGGRGRRRRRRRRVFVALAAAALVVVVVIIIIRRALTSLGRSHPQRDRPHLLVGPGRDDIDQVVAVDRAERRKVRRRSLGLWRRPRGGCCRCCCSCCGGGCCCCCCGGGGGSGPPSSFAASSSTNLVHEHGRVPPPQQVPERAGRRPRPARADDAELAVAVGPEAHQQAAEPAQAPRRAHARGEAGPERRGWATAVLEGEAGVALGAVEEVLRRRGGGRGRGGKRLSEERERASSEACRFDRF